MAFYGDVLGLDVLFQLHDPDPITGFALGGAYLMVEDGGVAKTDWDPGSLRRLRFNVADLDAAIAELRAKGVDTHCEDHSWGSVARFTDPDGNPCQLRSEADFGGQSQSAKP